MSSENILSHFKEKLLDITKMLRAVPTFVVQRGIFQLTDCNLNKSFFKAFIDNTAIRVNPAHWFPDSSYNALTTQEICSNNIFHLFYLYFTQLLLKF